MVSSVIHKCLRADENHLIACLPEDVRKLWDPHLEEVEPAPSHHNASQLVHITQLERYAFSLRCVPRFIELVDLWHAARPTACIS